MSLRVVGYRDGHRIVSDEGPSIARSTSRPYSTVHADNVGQMRPLVTAGGLSFDWHGPKRKAMTVVGKPRVTCGIELAVLHVPCARTLGHSGCHRSAEWMARDAAVRRSGFRGSDA